MSAPPTFLTTALSVYSSPRTGRPHVTLTFAQSMDAKIAGIDGQQLILSGKESMVMTHWMRTMHDAILVGIGTALNDDPQLNARHLPPRITDNTQTGHTHAYHLPRPVILDSKLRLSPDCKLLRNYRAGTGRRPWLICTSDDSQDPSSRVVQEKIARKHSLEKAGARILEMHTHGAGMDIPDILTLLHQCGIESLMVEGGASVIRSFFAACEKGDRTIDTLIVTVAPVIVGKGGVGYEGTYQVPLLDHVSTQTVGRDTVFILGGSKAT